MTLTQRMEPRALLGLAMFTVLTVPFAFAALGEPSPHQGAWLKPFKFALSLALYFATLAVLAAWLPETVRKARWFALMLWLALAAAILEILWIGTAAALGVPSHYNTNPPWNALYPIAGVLATYLIFVFAVYGVLFALYRTPALPPGVRIALVSGGLLTFIFTLVTASALASNPGHFVGAEPDGAARWLLFGWSTSVGDLRPAHFLATHAIQVIPLAALAIGALRLPRPRTLTLAVAALYTALTLIVFREAVAGKPPLSTFALL